MAEKKVIFGELGRLKPEKIEEYEALHANPWPQVVKTIHDCNMRNYSIFIEDDVVFGYYEYTGSDYEADMAKMAADPLNQEWWAHTRPCFTKYNADKAEAFYTDMQQIFYLE